MTSGESLHTQRLLLRRWRPDDADWFARMNADPEVMGSIGDPLSREQSDAFLQRIERSFDDHGYGLWVVEVLASGEPVGFTGLALQTFDAAFTPAVEVGWRLVRSSWGHGYATEAATSVLDHAFGLLDLEEVVSITTSVNVRSRAVMRRLGLQHVPDWDYEQEHFAPGHPLRPAVVHATDRERWQSRTA